MDISNAEFEVMKVLWDKGKATSLDIIDELKGIKKWNESTIRTLITRLQAKNAIKIVEKNGKTYTYTATIKEDKFKSAMSKKFLQGLYNGSVNSMLLNFVKQKNISKKDLEDVIAMIDGEDEMI